MNGTASAKARNESVGKPGSSVDDWSPAGVHGHERDREDERRDEARGLARRAHERAARDRADLRPAVLIVPRRSCCSASASSVAPSSVRPVFARKTSSSVGARSSRSTMSTPFASTARTMSVSPSPSRSRTATSRVVASGSPNCARNSAIAGRSLVAVRDRVHARPADLRLQRGRRPLGDDLPLVDDPDPVREDVRLLEVLRRQEDRHALLAAQARDLLPERGPALRVEAGRRLVEEEDRAAGGRARARDRGVASCRPSSPTPCGRLRRRARRARGARPRCSRRWSLRTPWSVACSRRWSRPVSSGSSAASWSATPISDRTFGPSLTTS